MFRWNLMLQNLFGLRREQPKARRPKETTKLRLEVLEDRTLPSGTPQPIEYVASPPVPPVAALTSFVKSTINQWTQFVVMVQQEFLGYYQGLIQELAQAVFSAEQMIARVDSTVVQEVDHFFGINPNTSNPSFNTVVSQPGNGVGRGNNSGSGSGASAPTTDSSPNQPSNHSMQQSGNGSGTGSSGTTKNHGNSPGNTLHPMTGSGGSGSGGNPGSTDELYWNPKDAGDPTDWSRADNWYDKTQGKQGVMAPTSDNPLFFDGTQGSTISQNAKINWYSGDIVASITVQNGYNAQMTISDNAWLTDNGTISMDGSSKLYVYFGNNSNFVINGGGEISNMNLTGYPTGTFQLNGGTTTIAQATSYTETTGVNIYVGPDATLRDEGYTTLKYTNDKLVLDINGTMNVFFGTGAGSTLIDSSGYVDNYIIVDDGGTLKYFGSGLAKDTFFIPVLLQNGNFILTAASNAPDGGTLTVKGANASTNNVSVYVTYSGSTVQLSHGATLVADSGYYQSDGILETMDTTTCALTDNSGTTNIAGGGVLINQPGGVNKGGTLSVNTGNLNLNGSLTVRIWGNTGNPGTSDQLNVSGTLTLQGNSYLQVLVAGNKPIGGNTWVVINSSNIVNDFTTKKAVPQTTLNYTPNPPAPYKKGQYLLSY